jgi:hypothetical protein
MTKDCSEEPGLPHETVTVRVTNADPSTVFDVNICLYDFSGAVIVCHKVTRNRPPGFFNPLDPGDEEFPEGIFVIDAPDLVRVWRAQTFVCAGIGTVQFLEQNCICNCINEPEPCDSPDCFVSMPVRHFNEPCPGPPFQETSIGKHYGKVKITNPNPTKRTVRYWYQYVQAGQMRMHTSGVSVPANGTVRICFTVLMVETGDGIRTFDAYEWPDCPGIGSGTNDVMYEIVRDACCDANGQNCVERYVPPDYLPCVP